MDTHFFSAFFRSFPKFVISYVVRRLNTLIWLTNQDAFCVKANKVRLILIWRQSSRVSAPSRKHGLIQFLAWEKTFPVSRLGNWPFPFTSIGPCGQWCFRAFFLHFFSSIGCAGKEQPHSLNVNSGSPIVSIPSGINHAQGRIVCCFLSAWRRLICSGPSSGVAAISLRVYCSRGEE
jgi:hypothetical protein